MNLIDSGTGTPVVVIPGIQGRWEWHLPGIQALAGRSRVVTFSFADEPTANARYDSSKGFVAYCDQVLDALDQAGLGSAAICGISYGGLIAATFAARHPERVSSLILVSAVPPSWKPDARVLWYLRAPRLLLPVFMLASLRLFTEIRRAAPGLMAAIRTGIQHVWNALTHMFSPARMARRVRLVSAIDLTNQISGIRTPTLIIVGERDLDRVVPTSRTLEYLSLLPQARATTLERTGHLGCITRPHAFAEIIETFASSMHPEPNVNTDREMRTWKREPQRTPLG